MSAFSSPISPAVPIDAATTLGAVALTVPDLARSQAFYEGVVGLQARERDDGELGFGASGEPDLIRLHADASAPAPNPRATGLFHLAVLLPSREALAHALARLTHTRWPLDGASDHLVSEALYLSDPDGNGIEIYRDRARTDWPRDEDGTLQMATLSLDLRDLAGELPDFRAPDSHAPAGTRIGHVHLQVSELDAIETFYHDVLGFDVTVRGYPGALFTSAGGYHHHVGLNTWHSAGMPPPAPGSVGLRFFEVLLPDGPALERVLARIRGAGVTVEPAGSDGAAIVHDPSGNAILLRRA